MIINKGSNNNSVSVSPIVISDMSGGVGLSWLISDNVTRADISEFGGVSLTGFDPILENREY